MDNALIPPGNKRTTLESAGANTADLAFSRQTIMRRGPVMNLAHATRYMHPPLGETSCRRSTGRGPRAQCAGGNAGVTMARPPNLRSLCFSYGEPTVNRASNRTSMAETVSAASGAESGREKMNMATPPETKRTLNSDFVFRNRARSLEVAATDSDRRRLIALRGAAGVRGICA